jgi:hypothetical protein
MASSTTNISFLCRRKGHSAISALKFAVLEGTVMTHQFVLAHEMMAHASPRNDEASKRHIHGHKSNNALTLTVA